ncbi:hypothetical protein JCM10914A_17030 [Paenibacillus sp. JCM 10914]
MICRELFRRIYTSLCFTNLTEWALIDGLEARHSQIQHMVVFKMTMSSNCDKVKIPVVTALCTFDSPD